MTKPTKLIRIDTDTANKINTLAIEASRMEGKVVHNIEVIRRTFNIPTLPPVILEDAKAKRYKR